MNAFFTTLSIGLIFAWFVVLVLRFFLDGKTAAIGGVVIGLLLAVLARHTFPVLVLASLIVPASLGLSFLIARWLARPFVAVKSVPVLEQIAVLALLLGYYLASAGVTMFDPYRFGYYPLTAGAMAAVLCLYAGIRGYWGFALLPVAAQFSWLAGLGSSNYFDHLISALMVPVLCISILKTVFIRPATRADP